MKKIVTVTEVDGEGLVALMGKKVVLFCLNYIYTGTLAWVNQTCVLLEDAAIVYETGAFGDSKFKDAQEIGSDLYVQTGAIESFSETKKSWLNRGRISIGLSVGLGLAIATDLGLDLGLGLSLEKESLWNVLNV